MAVFVLLPFVIAGFLAATSNANIDYAPDFENIPNLAFTSSFFATSKEFSGYRVGSSTNDHMCDRVTGVPSHLTFITRYNHYRKYTHAYGIPIVSSAYVSDDALKRACYVVRFLLADSFDIRFYLYKNYGRAGVIGSREGVRSIPEHSYLPAWWDQRARGLGGVLGNAISTGAEENLLCWSNDRYRNEDIFLHEFSHGIQEVAITAGAIRGFNTRLQSAYNYARSRGLWVNTYAMSTWKEYFAEGVQSYFGVNAYANPANGVHNHVNTRAKLRSYDPVLFGLVKEVFPCENIFKKRCDKSVGYIPLKMDCDGKGGGRTQPPLTSAPTQPPVATNATSQPPVVTTSVTSAPTQPPVVTNATSQPPNVTKSVTSASTQPPVVTSRLPITTTSTVMPPIITTTPPSCVDKNRYCASWAAIGECSRNPGYMNIFCSKSCDRCGGCIDLHQNCGVWASTGYCRISSWMLANCKKSCNLC